MKENDYEKTIYELNQLLEVTKVLNSTLHFKKLVDSILFTFMAQARCVKAALYIGKELEPDVMTLQRNYMGFEMNPNIPIQLSCKTSNMKNLAKKRKCITNAELSDLENYQSEETIKYIEENVELLIPLVINEKVAGLVLLGGRIDSTPIEDSEKEFLSQIGIYASIAIQNAILFDMATMDMMTELKVRHYITKFIDESITSGDHNFSIIMLDIDDFKQVNDTYGHSIGDETIINVAHIIKKAIRAQDIASRFGGEEFVIMLRETNLEDSLHVAERIRKGVEDLSIHSKDGKVKVTISLGAAEFDNSLDNSPQDIIERADQALYKSKKSGKNRITTA